MTPPKKKETHERTPAPNKGGRPARPMPELISDTPENIAKACMQGLPKKRWRYEEEMKVASVNVPNQR